MNATEMERKFGIADALRFEDTPGGLTRAVISTERAEAVIYLQGAHVASWTPRGQRPVLFMSSRSQFEPGKPIRGGVPIVFPWFGPRGGGLAGPLHGFARIEEWSVEGAELRADGTVALELALGPSAVSRELGYDGFELRFRAAIGASLAMELEVRNRSAEPFRFEEALHTYFAIADVHRVAVSGLEGTTYIDKTDGLQRKVQPAEPVRFAKETNQVHFNTGAACVIEDPVWERRIVVEKNGSASTVVWNPWAETNRGIPDMAPEDWREMICVETANAIDDAVTVPAGGAHTMRAAIRVD